MPPGRDKVTVAQRRKPKSLKQTLKAVDPQLTVVSGRRRCKSLAEFQGNPGVEERISANPVPRRVRREYDEDWNRSNPLICPICRREVDELFPYGFAGKRLACAECIKRRRRLLEIKARVLEHRARRVIPRGLF